MWLKSLHTRKRKWYSSTIWDGFCQGSLFVFLLGPFIWSTFGSDTAEILNKKVSGLEGEVSSLNLVSNQNLVSICIYFFTIASLILSHFTLKVCHCFQQFFIPSLPVIIHMVIKCPLIHKKGTSEGDKSKLHQCNLPKLNW